MPVAKLKAPFVYFGGKSSVASLIWSRIGDCPNIIEPFCGSAAFLLARPTTPKIETINDAHCMIANFWRATIADPEGVAKYANSPVNEADLHSRHRWLVLSEDAKSFREKMATDPEYYDVKVAGWWVWGINCWIGSGWCRDTASSKRVGLHPGNGIHSRGAIPQQKPHIGNAGRSTHSIGAGGRPQLADAYDVGRGVHSHGDVSTCDDRLTLLVDWFSRLRDRLRLVRVCCGDWLRVCDSHSTTTRHGTTGIFFDPPYGAKADRDNTIYAVESETVAGDVRAYCLERGSDPAYRICLAGYAGEGHEELEDAGWDVVSWRSHGGYGNTGKDPKSKGKANKSKERLWFSPHCDKPGYDLFSTCGGGGDE